MVGIGAAAAVLFAVNVTAVIPATPSNIGVFQLATISVLTTGFGVSDRRRARLRRDPAGGRDRDRCRPRPAGAGPRGCHLAGHAPAGALGGAGSPAARTGRPRTPAEFGSPPHPRRYPVVRPSRAAEGPGPEKPPQPPNSPEQGKVRQPGPMEVSISASQIRQRQGLPRGRPRARRRLRRRHGRDPGAVRPDQRGLRRARGQMPRGAGAQPPRRDRGRPRVDARGRRRGGRDRHLPGLAAEARRVGARRAHARDQHQGGRDRPQGRGRLALRRRLDRADRLPARLRRPDPRRDLVPRAGRGLRRAGARPGRGRRRPDHHRDGAGHPRGQGGGVRRPRGVRRGRAHAADPDLGLAATAGRQDAARHRHRRGADDARRARRRRDRPQLLDRPRGHARRDPLPRRALAAARALHPERRPAPPGAGRRDDLPRDPGAALDGARRVRRAPWRQYRRRLLRDHPGAHRGDRRAGRRPGSGRAPRHPARRRSAR